MKEKKEKEMKKGWVETSAVAGYFPDEEKQKVEFALKKITEWLSENDKDYVDEEVEEFIDELNTGLEMVEVKVLRGEIVMEWNARNSTGFIILTPISLLESIKEKILSNVNKNAKYRVHYSLLFPAWEFDDDVVPGIEVIDFINTLFDSYFIGGVEKLSLHSYRATPDEIKIKLRENGHFVIFEKITKNKRRKENDKTLYD